MRTRRRAWKWGGGLAAVAALAFAALFFSADSPLPPPQNAKEVRMPGSKTLVIYYSRTGTTQTLAKAIAQATGADLEQLEDTVDRRGASGFLRSLWDTLRKSETKLIKLGVDPTAYELVVIGTPDWGASVSAPVRTFLNTYRGRLPRVAFFLTDGTRDHEAVFQTMATLVDAQPLAKLGVPQVDVKAGRYAEAVQAFVKELEAKKPPAPVELAPAAF